MLLEQIKRSLYIVKLCKNATVADPSANYILLDYGFELSDVYVHVKWFYGEQVHQGPEDDEHSDSET